MPSIVMIGTAPGGASGVATVVETYAAHGLFQRWDAVYLPTHRGGRQARKVLIALGAWMEFMARLAHGRVALLHVHLASNASFWRKALFILPAQLFRIGYVLQVHGGGFAEFHASRLPLTRSLIRYVLRHAERVIAVSPEWRDALAAIEPASRIEIVPNPVEVPPWQAGLEARPPSVVFLGVLCERKGVYDLLHAWPAVVKTVSDARLVLCGPGELESVRALARELGIEPSVHVAGWVAGEAKESLVRSAWAVVLPSHVEALPMAILEALAAGVPVVATRVGGVPSAVENGKQGFLVTPHDVPALSRALGRVLAETPLRKAMGRAARARAVTEFSAEVVVPRIEALWRQIVPAQEIRTRIRAA
jgi:glycosyltransferase involved in cell wall biosynthesis